MGTEPTKRNAIVRKHNYLIEAKHAKLLDVRAMRLVALAASMIAPKDRDFKTYHIPVKDITKSSDVYSTVKVGDEKVMLIDKITDQLVAGVIKLPKANQDGTHTGESFAKYAYFSKCEYIKGRGYVEVQFHPDLKEFYLDLKGNYTQLSMEILRNLPSSYSFRLYELLKQYAQGGIYRRSFALDELFDMLAIKPDQPGQKSSYRNWSKFREKVLLPTQKNFERYTDLTFIFNAWASHGRAFTDIEFVMRKNKKFFQADLFQQPKEDDVIDLIPQGIIDKIPPLQWTDKDVGCQQIATEIFDAQGTEALRFYVDYVFDQDQKEKIRSWGKYMRSCWKNQLYETYVAKQAEAQHNKKKAKAQKSPDAEKQRQEAELAAKALKEKEALDQQIQQILQSDQAEAFLSFITEQVEQQESLFVRKRFTADKGSTRENIYRLYLPQYLETHELPESISQEMEEEGQDLVAWLDTLER